MYCLISGSALTDIYKNKIFNNWILAGVICGMAVWLSAGSPEQIWMKLIRSICVLLLFLPVYLFGGIGGGDIKLFMVIAMFLNNEDLLTVIIMSFVIGAVIGVAKVISKRNLKETIHFAVPIMISVLLVTNPLNLIGH